MKDFIPKGTGNSRNLKSAIPAGTTWEQALAQLRAGTFPIDLAGVNAAGVQQMGDALNKANLLSDDVAAILRLDDSEASVNNALLKLAVDAGFVFAVTVKTNDNIPVPGITISALTPIGGGSSVVTNQNGYAIGVSTQESIKINISGFLDLDDYNSTHSSTGVITRVVVTVRKKDTKEVRFTTSGSFKFSPIVKKFDAHLLGGGGQGGYKGDTNAMAGGGGGGGGNSTLLTNYTPISTGVYSFEIGAGGYNGVYSYGDPGGATKLTAPDGSVHTAAGGGAGAASGGAAAGGTSANGGIGGIGGAVGKAGGNGTVRIFGDPTKNLVAGGGGGGPGCNDPMTGKDSPGGAGGTPSGATGGTATGYPGGGGYGGGGGGSGNSNVHGGRGGNGLLYVRWRY